MRTIRSGVQSHARHFHEQVVALGEEIVDDAQHRIGRQKHRQMRGGMNRAENELGRPSEKRRGDIGFGILHQPDPEAGDQKEECGTCEHAAQHAIRRELHAQDAPEIVPPASLLLDIGQQLVEFAAHLLFRRRPRGLASRRRNLSRTRQFRQPLVESGDLRITAIAGRLLVARVVGRHCISMLTDCACLIATVGSATAIWKTHA